MKRTRFSQEQIESEQLSDPEAAALTDNEQRLHIWQKQQHWDTNAPLEQERIPWVYAWGALCIDTSESASSACL